MSERQQRTRSLFGRAAAVAVAVTAFTGVLGSTAHADEIPPPIPPPCKLTDRPSVGVNPGTLDVEIHYGFVIECFQLGSD